MMASEKVKEALNEEQQITSISVSARIPDFWRDEPKLWFIQTEAALNPQKASDEARYQIVVSKLGKEVLSQVTDILLDPPASGKYEALKTRLCNIYAQSEARQVQKLIGEMELGDQKPSQLLRKMKDLARGKVTDETLAVLWKNHLPTTVRSVLAATESKDMEILASVADKIIETITTRDDISKIDATKETTDIVAEVRSLGERIKGLESRYSRPRYNNWGRRNYRSRSRDRSASSRRTPQDPNWLCVYHFRFGQRANKCVDPCNWNKQRENKPEN